MKFLDTNLLVYAADDTDIVKHRIAMDLVSRALSGEAIMISAQVVNEFASVMYRKFRRTDDEIKRYIGFFEPIHNVAVLPGYSARAVEIKKLYGLQYFDSLLLATAEDNGCNEFVSEDLNDGQLYCGMIASNPFKPQPPPKEICLS